MKKIDLYICLLVLSITLVSCSKEVAKPKITIGEYSVQATTSKGVVEKILSETDYKKMHEISLAVESSRSVNCISVSNECNILGKILNRIVKSTNDGMPKEADNVAIYKLVAELDEEFRKGQEKLSEQWKEYINAHTSEVNSK